MATASKTTTTGKDGTYVFENVLDGNYKVRADHSAYAQSESKQNVFVATPATPSS